MNIIETLFYKQFEKEIKTCVGYFASDRDRYVKSTNFVVLFYDDTPVAIYFKGNDSVTNIDLRVASRKDENSNLCIAILAFQNFAKYI